MCMCTYICIPIYVYIYHILIFICIPYFSILNWLSQLSFPSIFIKSITFSGKFGSGVLSYFKFLRWLFLLNVVISFFVLVFVVAPQLMYSPSYKTNNASFTGMEFLTGKVNIINERVSNIFLKQDNSAVIAVSLRSLLFASQVRVSR